MMYSVMARSVKNIFQRSKVIYKFSMNPELNKKKLQIYKEKLESIN